MLSKWEIPPSCWKACFHGSFFLWQNIIHKSKKVLCCGIFLYIVRIDKRNKLVLYWLWNNLSCPILGYIYVFIFQSISLCSSVTSINMLDYFSARRMLCTTTQREKKVIKDITIATAVVWDLSKCFLPHKSAK